MTTNSVGLSEPGVVILGAGQAGYQAAIALRNEGYVHAITLIGEEAHPPYQRPPLSKTYLAGGIGPSALYLATDDIFERQHIARMSSQPAVRIDRDDHVVMTAGGHRVPYKQLILALGARNRTLPVPGTDLDGVVSLRSLDDAMALQARLSDSGSANEVVIIGGGFLGLELASTLAAPGRRISVVESGDRIMSRAISSPISQALHRRHAEAGCRLHMGTGLAEIRGINGKVDAVILSDGRELPADLVILCVGVLPNSELAMAAGLAVDNGIVVGSDLTTADPDIFAIGDCANVRQPDGDSCIRLETVQNATDQARHVARQIASGVSRPYWSLPCFWSHQAAATLHIAGLAQGAGQQVTIGDIGADRFSNLLFRDELLVAVESLNSFADHRAAQKILGSGTKLTIDQARSEGFTLRAFAQSIDAAA